MCLKSRKRGLVYYSGYPLNEDCYEPYKDVYIIDVSEPSSPAVKGVLPRPMPPKEADFKDYCQRRGSFGPKRTGAYHQPGTAQSGLLPYNFYNAGLQVFDVSKPNEASVVAYFVPPFLHQTKWLTMPWAIYLILSMLSTTETYFGSSQTMASMCCRAQC